MKNFSVVIAEKSSIRCKAIQQLLKLQNDFDPIALTFNADEVIDICKKVQADVLFIHHDLTLDDESNNILELLPIHTQVIYIANDNVQAAYAFELDVIDYLVAPISATRFQKCINKLVRTLSQDLSPPLIQVQAMLRQLQITNVPNEPLVVKDSGRIRVIDPENILWVGGAGNYVELHLTNEERPILHRETLNVMLSKLANLGFVRIHRSALVKKRSITELKPTDNGDYLVTLQNGDLLNLSRRYKASMAGILS